MGNVYIPPSQDARYIEGESEFYIVEQLKIKNYARNGGFENGFDVWSNVGIIALSTGKYGGHAAYLSSSGVLTTQFESATSGSWTSYQRMYVSFDAKGEADSGAGPLTLTVKSGTPATLATLTVTPKRDEWTRYTVSFVPTTTTSSLEFSNAAWFVSIDNVHIGTQPVDLHVPMPHALALPIFDYSDQSAPYFAAEGLTIKITPLSSYGFKLSGVVGLGYENPQHNTITLQTGEERLLSTVPTSKDFSITGTIGDSSSANVDRKKAALIAAITKSPDKPVILAHKRKNCSADIGNLGFIQCVYTGGLGIQRTNNYSQDISLDFRQLDPSVYYAPKSLNIATCDALRKEDDSTAAAAFPRERNFVRYKNQPYRSMRNTGSSTMSSSIPGGAIEDKEGGLWLWGKPADDIAIANGQTVAAQARCVVRLYKGSAYPTFHTFTHPTSAEIHGLLLLQNGDIVAHGRFTSLGAYGVAVWNSRAGTWGLLGALTSTNALFTVQHMRRVGNRLWFTGSANVTVNGTSLGSDAQCARSVFYTDNYFLSATRYEIEPSLTTALQIETDDSGNVYVRSVTSSGDDDCRIYRLTTLSDGSLYFWLTAVLDEDSSHVLESYIVGSLLKRKSGVAISYSYWPAGYSGAASYYIMEILDISNKSVQAVPAGSFYESGGFTDDNRNSYSFTYTDSTGSAGATSNFKYRQFDLSGAVEYSAGKKFMPAVSRSFQRTASWEFGKEAFVNYYRAIPTQTLVTNPAAVRVSPLVRFVGGGYSTFIGRMINETNGSSVAFSGRLRGGEEFIFDPSNPVLPEGLTLIDNSGPLGIFCLDPGTNSILLQMNTLWATVPGGAVSGSDCCRHLELTALTTHAAFTGKISISEASGTLSIKSVSPSGSTSTIATGSTTPAFSEPSGTLNVLTMTQSGGSGVAGLALMYSGTYTGYTSGTVYVPLCELIVPTATLTIEAGTI